MKKLLEKLDNLQKELNQTDEVRKIKKLNHQLQKNTPLLKLLEEYHKYPNPKLKKQIINDSFFKEYKEAETNLNILILNINSKLKQITKKGSCKL